MSVFLLLLNFSFGLTAVMNLADTEYSNYMEEKINESLVEDVLGSASTGGSSFVDTIFTSTVYVAKAVGLFFQFLYDTTMGLPQMLSSPPFSFPATITATIVALQVVIYAVGIASFLRGFAI